MSEDIGNGFSFKAFGATITARGWAVLGVVIILVAYGPAVGIAYINYRGFMSLEATMAQSRLMQGALYDAYLDSVDQLRYDNELIVHQAQLELCVRSLEKRQNEYEMLRRNWVIEQIRVLCPFVRAVPKVPNRRIHTEWGG